MVLCRMRGERLECAWCERSSTTGRGEPASGAATPQPARATLHWPQFSLSATNKAGWLARVCGVAHPAPAPPHRLPITKNKFAARRASFLCISVSVWRKYTVQFSYYYYQFVEYSAVTSNTVIYGWPGGPYFIAFVNHWTAGYG